MTADRRDAILRAVAFTGERLLRPGAWAARIDDVLAELGHATGVDRVYVFRVRDEDGTLLTDQLHEWAADGVEPQIDNPELQGLPFVEAGFGRWEVELRVGGTIDGAVDDFPASEQEFLRAQAIDALAVVPVFVDELWWGFVGFDICDGARPFEAAEVAALRTAAGIIGAALAKERATEEADGHRARLAVALQRERDAAEQLRELERMRTAFLDGVSHELRTPLTVVIGIAETLRRDGDVLSPEDRHVLVSRLSSSAARLGDVLSHLIDLNRLRHDDDHVAAERTLVRPLVEGVVRSHRGVSGRAVEVDVRVESATVDSSLVTRILRHLLDNVAAHTAPDDTSWVQVRGTDAQGLHIVVADDGPGVPVRHHASIFEPFSHGDSQRPHAPGTGVGLSLVSGLALLHGGRAWCQDRTGGGAEFHVVLAPPAPTAVTSAELTRAR